MNKRYNNIFKGIWLVLSLLCLGLGAMHTIRDGFDQGYIFFVFAVVAFLLFLVRRSWSKRNKNG
ncbi:MAG: hypothetical protein ACOC4B_01465 [Bacteroidota bacterium]